MAMIAQVIDGISFDASQGEVITRLGDDITVGLVLLSRVHQRRDNFRCMNAQQLAGLRAAVDRIGFQSLVTLNVENDGTFGIIDGHHRFAEACAVRSPEQARRRHGHAELQHQRRHQRGCVQCAVERAPAAASSPG